MWIESSVLELGRDRPMNKSSSRFKFVFVMSMCIRLGCLVMIEATLMENSNVADVKSLWLKLNVLTQLLRFSASII